MRKPKARSPKKELKKQAYKDPLDGLHKDGIKLKSTARGRVRP